MPGGHNFKRPPIPGRTALVTIMGQPIGQVRSPTTLDTELQRAGVDAVLPPLDLAMSDAQAFMQMEHVGLGGAR